MPRRPRPTRAAPRPRAPSLRHPALRAEELAAVGDPPASTRAALVAWAGREGVIGLTRGFIDVLADAGDVPEAIAELAAEAGTSTLGDALLFAPQARGPRRQPSPRERLAEAARLVLRQEIAFARRIASESLPALPADPTLRSFAKRLLEERARVRATNAPAGYEYAADVEILTEEAILLVGVTRAGREPVTVQLRFEQELAVQCECLREGMGCRHVVEAIDGVMQMMNDPHARKVQAALAEALRTPWRRLLGELEAIVDATATATRPGRDASRATSWRLKRLKNGLRLVPCEIRGKQVQELSRYDFGGPGWGPVDHAVMSLLGGYSYGGVANDPTHLAAALELLKDDPRLVYAEGTRTRPLVVEHGRVELCSESVEDGLRLWLALDGRELRDEDLACLPPEGGTILVVDASTPDAPAQLRIGTVDGPLSRVFDTITRHGRVMPASELDGLGRLAPRLAEVLPVRLPEGLLGRALPAVPRAVLRLEGQDRDGLGVAALVRVHPLAGALVPGEGPRDVFVLQDGERCHVRRDVEGERPWLMARLTHLGLIDAVDGARRLLHGDEALDLVARLDDEQLRGQLDIEWVARAPSQVLRAGALRVDVREKRDWFSLSGGLEVEGEHVALAELLAALQAGRRYVRVSGERWVALGESLRRQLRAVADLTTPAHELPAMAAPLLEEALGEALGVAPLRWRELVARAHAAATAPPAPVPALGVTLRDYQVSGFEWMSRLAAWGAGACLADDMGLGKTIQALAVLAARASLGPALVVAPTSVGWNWAREAERCAPGLRTILFARSERDPVVDAAGPGDVIIASYGLVVRHAEAFARRRFATLVLDEAHALKNPATRRAQVATTLQADFKLALTGTPLENRLSELWSLFRVVAPGLLGGLDRFRERFAVPIERDRDESQRAALARLTRPFLLRRLKGEVARELPPRTEIQVDVALGKAERAFYDAIRVQAAQALAGELGGDKRFAVLAALTRLRQAACDVGLLDASIGTPSSKLARLVELVDELRQEGHRVLVFSQFTSLLERARAAVAASGATCLYLDGATPEARRAELVDAFQGGQGDAFFISLKAGGAGLNLTGADNVIHLDPWWNPAVEDQATDRAHRIGQERPVTVYRLVATGTVEEAILRMHADKRALVAGVLEGAGGAATLDAAQLAQLLAASSDVASDDEPAEASELTSADELPPPPAPAHRSRPATPPHGLVEMFRTHLLETGSKPSTATAYTYAVSRWMASRTDREPALKIARAAIAAADAPGDDLPRTTRAALRRFSAMIAS